MALTNEPSAQSSEAAAHPNDPAPRAPVWIGIDIGTSMAKAAAFDSTGELIAVASRPVPLLHPGPARVEQDPEVIVGSTAAVIAEVCATLGVHRPELVAITGQGDGCWLFDQYGVPVRAAISWMDGRAAGILAEWTESGVCDAMFAENGNYMFPGAPAPILAWLDRHEPEVLDRTASAGYVKDLMLQRLTGLRATDATDASLPFGSLAPDEDYSAEVLRLTGLGHRAGLLAPIGRPLPHAPLTAFGAGATTLEPGTPIVAAPYDIPACVIGSGILQPGDGLLIAGTTLACSVLTDSVDLSGVKAGMTITMPEPGRWLRVMAAMVGTASLDWALSILDIPFTALNSLLEQTPAGANGVEVLPYLAPSGERAPFVDPAARAQFTGLSLTSTRGDMVRALCEGLAYAGRSCFEAAGLTGDVYVCGGGAKSAAWMQIFASVLGRDVFLAREGEVGARGAVLAAAAALGRPLDAKVWTGPTTLVQPDPDQVPRYEAGYRRFQAQLRSAQQLWVR